MIYQNTIVKFLSLFIPDQDLRGKFINKYQRKTRYRILRDENISLRKDLERLKQSHAHDIRKLYNEFEYSMHKYALPEQRPQMLKDWYRRQTGGGELDLESPQTFNEKINWMKLHDMDDLKTKLADKYAVRSWVKEKIGEQYLIPLLGVYERPEDIDWDTLPDEFVIKCNHGSAMNIIVNDRNSVDIENINNRLQTWLGINYAFYGFEMQYEKIEPKVLIEKKIENEGHNDLFDYKFYCFGGEPIYIQFMLDRFQNIVKVATFDLNWVRQPFAYNHPMTDKTIEKPSNLDLMINIAKKLSEGFKFVRVDLYRMNNGTIYFGEMTFTPDNAKGTWYGKEMGLQFGDLIKLN